MLFGPDRLIIRKRKGLRDLVVETLINILKNRTFNFKIATATLFVYINLQRAFLTFPYYIASVVVMVSV